MKGKSISKMFLCLKEMGWEMPVSIRRNRNRCHDSSSFHNREVHRFCTKISQSTVITHLHLAHVEKRIISLQIAMHDVVLHSSNCKNLIECN